MSATPSAAQMVPHERHYVDQNTKGTSLGFVSRKTASLGTSSGARSSARAPFGAAGGAVAGQVRPLARLLLLSDPGYWCSGTGRGLGQLPGLCSAYGGVAGLELRRSLWLEAGSVRQRRRVKTGPTAATSTTITAALAPLHAGCHEHGESARDFFCGRRRQCA